MNDARPDHVFAIATREQIGSGAAPRVARRSHGLAIQRGTEITASDSFPDHRLREELVARCDEAFAAIPGNDAVTRIVASSRYVERNGEQSLTVSETITVAVPYGDGQLSVVTSVGSLDEDVARLNTLAASQPSQTDIDPRSLPILWCGGSAAILLHEAVGHAAELGAVASGWPEWLRVTDEPRQSVDDVGEKTTTVSLLDGERPSARRRQTFRDVALRRMSAVFVRHEGASFATPDRRIEIHLLSGGRYESLNGEVTLFVTVADLVEGGRTQRMPPFTLRASGAEIARALVGAAGDAIRYPGVICSSEGQELIVESYAPRMITAALS